MMWTEHFLRGMSEYFTLERTGAKQGQWEQESPVRKVLQQIQRSADTDCSHKTMRQGFLAMKDREESKESCEKEKKATESTFEKIREAHEKVANEEIGFSSIVH